MEGRPKGPDEPQSIGRGGPRSGGRAAPARALDRVSTGREQVLDTDRRSAPRDHLGTRCEAFDRDLRKALLMGAKAVAAGSRTALHWRRQRPPRTAQAPPLPQREPADSHPGGCPLPVPGNPAAEVSEDLAREWDAVTLKLRRDVTNFTFHIYLEPLAPAGRLGGTPLFIHGRPGLGKTHLLHAIGNYVQLYGDWLTVRYVTVEEFTSEFVQAVRSGGSNAFRTRFRDADVLLVDDVQFLADKLKTEEGC